VDDWPLFCILEPNASAGGPVRADLFIINVGSEPYSDSKLAELAKSRSSADRKEVDPFIGIVMKNYLSDASITSIQEDDDFNKEKGTTSVEKISPTHWNVRIVNIKPGMILKLIVITTVDRAISSRARIESLPVRLSYARAP
jgi:hypothetical protein